MKKSNKTLAVCFIIWGSIVILLGVLPLKAGIGRLKRKREPKAEKEAKRKM